MFPILHYFMLMENVRNNTTLLCVICNKVVHYPHCIFCYNGGQCHIDCKLNGDDGYVEGVCRHQCLPFVAEMKRWIIQTFFDNRING